jgi:hypothetical protein
MQILDAKYIINYQITLEFDDKTTQTVDFEPFLLKNRHPQWNKYLKIQKFKKFKIENGNIVWGRDWDLIFPVTQLYKNKII